MTANHKIHRYAILPNFWSGSKNREPDPCLKIGHLAIDRVRTAENEWTYKVVHSNSTSGEELSLEFLCADDSIRSLLSPWRIKTRNNADGIYTTVDWNGEFSREGSIREIRIKTKGDLGFSAGSVEADISVTSNWALVDALPAIVTGNGTEEFAAAEGFAILDDLEYLRTGCYIRSLEKWMFSGDSISCDLQGYSVSGRGMPPSYWWVTENGDVAAVATMLSTYVLHGTGAA